MKIFNTTRDKLLAGEARVADTCFKRAKGLLGRPELKEGEALIIEPCNSIHTFFMRFPIDVVFADKNNLVVGAISNLVPFRLSPLYWRSAFAIELPAGVISSTNTAKGNTISLTY